MDYDENSNNIDTTTAKLSNNTSSASSIEIGYERIIIILDGKPYMSPMSNYGGVKAPNIESNEVQYPHITLKHEMEKDTAGAGEYRGGAGIEYAFQIYDDTCEIVMFGDGINNPPYGLNDGFEGSFNKPLFYHDGEWIQTASKEHPRKVSKGDIVSIHSAGGGGYGKTKIREKIGILRNI